MKISFTKQSLTEHILDIQRDDGSIENIVLETKSFMPHDLIHYVLEKEGNLNNSFWGLIKNGKKLEDFNSKEKIQNEILSNSELKDTEMIVGFLTGYFSNDINEEKAQETLKNIFSAYNKPVPEFLTEKFLIRCRDKFRKVYGHWKSTARGEPLILIF